MYLTTQKTLTSGREFGNLKTTDDTLGKCKLLKLNKEVETWTRLSSIEEMIKVIKNVLLKKLTEFGFHS